MQWQDEVSFKQEQRRRYFLLRRFADEMLISDPTSIPRIVLESSLAKTEIILCRNDSNGVGMAHATAPTLNANDRITFSQDVELDCPANAPFESIIHVFLPVFLAEIRLLLIKQEWIHPTIQVRVLQRSSAASFDGSHLLGRIERFE